MESWNVSQRGFASQIDVHPSCCNQLRCFSIRMLSRVEIWCLTASPRSGVESRHRKRKETSRCLRRNSATKRFCAFLHCSCERFVWRGYFFLNLSYWTCIYIYISFFLQWSVCCNKFTLPSTNNICFFSSLLHLTDSTATFPKGVLSLQTEFNWKLRLESAQ